MIVDKITNYKKLKKNYFAVDLWFQKYTLFINFSGFFLSYSTVSVLFYRSRFDSLFLISFWSHCSTVCFCRCCLNFGLFCIIHLYTVVASPLWYSDQSQSKEIKNNALLFTLSLFLVCWPLICCNL